MNWCKTLARLGFVLLVLATATGCCRFDPAYWWKDSGASCAPCGDPCDPCDTRR